MKGTKISKGVKNSYEIWTKLLIDWDNNNVTQKFQFSTEGKNIELETFFYLQDISLLKLILLFY